MELNRDLIIEKIEALLGGQMDKDAVYRWALGVAVSEDFAQFCKKDPVAAQVVQVLIDIQHNDVKSIPTLKALAYYRLCLKGEREYLPLGEIKDRDIEAPAVNVEEAQGLGLVEEGVKTFIDKFARSLRILTLIFGGIVFVASFFYVILEAAPGQPDRVKSAFKTFGLLIYSVFVILPPSFLVKEKAFLWAVPILLFGMIFSWYYSLNIIPGMFSGIVERCFLSALIIIPATVAFMLLFRAKGFRFRKKHTDF